MKIDINCDMGESFGRYTLGSDPEIMPFITSANIACGTHAGDPNVMDKTVRLAVEHGVGIGAHPAYPDLQGFGRRIMDLTAQEIENLILFQVSALAGFAHSADAELAHVKPHGALYNHAAGDRESARAIAKGVARFSRDVILVGLAGSLMVEEASDAGLRFSSEGFPERGYNPDGTLMSRSLQGAILDSPEEASAQALRLVKEGVRVTIGSRTVTHPVDTLCVHGDSPNALAVSGAIHSTLLENGIKLAPMGDIVR
jgi:UPF0271 protein